MFVFVECQKAMTAKRFEGTRKRFFVKARQLHVPEPVARLFAAVMEPRVDGELPSDAFLAALQAEQERLRASMQEHQESTTGSSAPIGGALEAHVLGAAKRLHVLAEEKGMPEAAALLITALDRCRTLLVPADVSTVSYPEAVRIMDPVANRPIGLWR